MAHPRMASDPAAATAQDAFYDIAERTLPGAGLGGYALPEDVRFVIRRGAGAGVEASDGRWYIDYQHGRRLGTDGRGAG